MNINEFVSLLNAVSLAAAENLSDEELALLSAAFSQVGVTFALVSVLRSTSGSAGANNEVVTSVI